MCIIIFSLKAQNKRDTLSGLPLWKCHSGVYEAGNDTEHFENVFRNFPGIAVCGKHIARKIVGPGNKQLIVDTVEKLRRCLFYLFNIASWKLER